MSELVAAHGSGDEGAPLACACPLLPSTPSPFPAPLRPPPRSLKPCSRCKVTTIDQQTGEEGLQPLPLLRELRSGAVLGWAQPPEFTGSVFFATNMRALSRGVVRVGDAVAVTAARARDEQWQPAAA